MFYTFNRCIKTIHFIFWYLCNLKKISKNTQNEKIWKIQKKEECFSEIGNSNLYYCFKVKLHSITFCLTFLCNHNLFNRNINFVTSHVYIFVILLLNTITLNIFPLILMWFGKNIKQNTKVRIVNSSIYILYSLIHLEC